MPADNTAPEVVQIVVKINGSPLKVADMNLLFEAEVESSLHLPSMFTLRFYDDDLALVDDTTNFAIGASVEIQMTNHSNDQLETVIKGEITAIEPHYSEDYVATLTVRGYDRSHRLNRGKKTRAFIQVKDSDIVQQIATGAGLTATVEATTTVHPQVIQDARTDLAFLHERAHRNGYEVFVDDRTLYFRKPKGTRGTVALAWGVELRSFSPRLSVAGQVNEVVVKGWDPTNKQPVVGTATSAGIVTALGVGKTGGQIANEAFSAGQHIVVHRGVKTQGEAEVVAQAILDEINAGAVEAEGLAFGNPGLVAGKKVTLTKLGTRFSGTYLITSARHIYNRDGYDTYFTVEGVRPKQMADLVDGPQPDVGETAWGGVVPAVVTNNTDPDNMGRVKVKFPWLKDDLESDWARVVTIGAGNTRGIQWLPEVNDEVMVAFEHGNFNYPVVVGSVWNGRDALVDTAAVSGGNVNKRLMKSRSGHTITLDDTDSAPVIEIKDKNNNTIKIETTPKKITITSTGDIELNATKDVTIKGVNVTVQASGNLEAKGTSGKVEASGPLVIKGATVNIN
jgi:phage protein D